MCSTVDLLTDDSNRQVPIECNRLNENPAYDLLSPIYGEYFKEYEDEFNIKCKYFDELSLINVLKPLKDNFTFSSLNCQALRAKHNEIYSLIDSFQQNNINITFFAFQELWVKENENMDMFNLTGFKWHTNLRKSRVGGGVGTLIKNEFNVVELFKDLTFQPGIIESICLKCQHKNIKFINLNIYRPPNQSSDQLEQFFDTLSTLLDRVNDFDIPFYLTGDINLDAFKASDINSNQMKFLEILTFNGILNTITKATRITKDSKSLIDFIGVGKNMQNFSLSAVLASSISDHFLILNSFKSNSNSKNSKANESDFFTKRLLGEEHLNSLNDALSNINWSFVTSCNDTDLAYSLFIDKFLCLFNIHCPIVSQKKNRRTQPIQPWMDNYILRCRLRKDELSRIRCNNFTVENNNIFKDYRNQYYRMVRNAKREYYKKSIREAGKDSKKLWATIKGAMGIVRKNENCTHLMIDGAKIEDRKQIADAFNSYLTQLGPKLTPEIPSTNKDFLNYLPPPINNNLFIAPLYPFKTINIIRSIKPKKSTDINNLSMFILSFCADRISIPLTHCYNLSISNGIFPSRMKNSKVSILHKSGPTDEPDNYRGISLIDNMSKPLERYISNEIVDFLNDNLILSKTQFGFRRGYSTVHNLLNLSNLVIDALSQNASCMSIFLDVRKCFDLINRDKLFAKLHYYGIRGPVLAWLKSYYKDRKQSVYFDGVYSETLLILLGVLQGSVLGPILFIIFINDLTNISDEFVLSLFADDAFAFLKKSDILNLLRHAREVIPKILEWYHANSLLVHPKKTQSIIFSGPRNRLTDEEIELKNSFEVYINMNNFGEEIDSKITKLELVTKENGGFVKHLGFQIDENLNFKYHLTSIYNKNSKIIYSLRMMRHLLNKKHLLLLYNSYIKSYIEYSCILLVGCPEYLINPILKQQKYAVRLIEGLESRQHTAEYFKSNFILPFPLLIEFNCSIFMHKLKLGKQPIIFENLWPFIMDQHQYNTRNRTNFAYVTGINRSYILNSPLHKLPTIYNNLPNNLKEIEDHKEFKRKCFTYFLNKIEF